MIPDKVHFVGSIALDSVEEVFRTLGSVLGNRLRRVPDGEPGGRRLWISWQYPLLRASCRCHWRMMSNHRKCVLGNWGTRGKRVPPTRIF